MPTSRPFAYNTGSTISGTEQVGNLAIGTPTSGFTSTGLNWWNGPDEDLGYVIAYQQSGGTQPTSTGVSAYVQFWRSSALTDQSFINLCNSVIKTQTFVDATTAKNYLNNNGYWTSWIFTSPTPTQTPTNTITPSVTPTKTVTPTITSSVTPTKTVTPTITPSVTPTNTITPSVTPTITPTPTRPAYTYYRWQITEAKTMPPNANCVQASEFVFQIGGVDQSMAGVTVTNPSGSNPAGEEPSKLVDGLLTTKGLDLNFVTNGNVTNFIFQFSSAKAFTGYRWATANDEEGRDPKSWTIAGSNNGTTWTTLHTVSGFAASSTRQTYQTPQTY